MQHHCIDLVRSSIQPELLKQYEPERQGSYFLTLRGQAREEQISKTAQRTLRPGSQC